MHIHSLKNCSFSLYISLIALILTVPLIGSAQIQGTIHDINNQPLSFANILLVNQKDSSVVTGIMSSDVGTFSITNFSPGKYLIKSSMIGYKTKFSLPFEIQSSNDHIHVIPILAEEDSKLLQNIDIVAKNRFTSNKSTGWWSMLTKALPQQVLRLLMFWRNLPELL